MRQRQKYIRRMQISVDSSREVNQKIINRLAGVTKAIPSVISNALNRAAEQGRTAATRKVTEVYTAKSRDVRNAIKISRAKKGSLMASLNSKGRRLTLSSFAHKPSSGDTTGSNRKQIRVSVRKDSGFKKLDNAFIWNGFIYQRNGSRYTDGFGVKREGITRRASLAIPQMLNNESVVEEIEDTMAGAFEKRLDYEVRRTLTKVVDK